MGTIFKDRKHKIFKNPNRHRVRFYSKELRKYYSIWFYPSNGVKAYPWQRHILGGYLVTKGDIMLKDALIRHRKYGGKPKEFKPIPMVEGEYEWEVNMK